MSIESEPSREAREGTIPIELRTRTRDIAHPLWWIHANEDGRGPVFLVLPAMGVPAAFYRKFARALSSVTGGPVAVGEFPGQGESKLRVRLGARFGYREIVEECIPAYVKQLRLSFSERPLLVLGHSLGGQLAIQALPEISHDLKGVVLVAAGTAHYEAWGPESRAARRKIRSISWIAKLLPWYPGRLVGFGGDQPRRLMRDWSRAALTGQYVIEGDSLGHELRQSFLSRVSTRLLAINIEGDQIAPLRATSDILRLIPSVRLHRHLAPPALGDQDRWQRHFHWVRSPGSICDSITRWLSPTTS